MGGGVPKLGVPFLGSPKKKDYSILGSKLGSPYLGKLPYIHIYIYIYMYTYTYICSHRVCVYIDMYIYIYNRVRRGFRV